MSERLVPKIVIPQIKDLKLLQIANIAQSTRSEFISIKL